VRFCSLHGRSGKEPAADNEASVGKVNKRNENQTRNKGLSGSAKTGHKRPYGGHHKVCSIGFRGNDKEVNERCSLHTELTEMIKKTQIELQTVELSLDGQNNKLHEELTNLRSDFNQMRNGTWAETL
jgi:hypothetical protein